MPLNRKEQKREDGNPTSEPQQTCLPQNTSVYTLNSQCPYFQNFHRIFFLADAPTISQNKAVSKVNFSIIYLVRTVCELTFSIIQMHYTRTALFCLHLRKSFSIEDYKTLSPKTMHHVCCFRWCRHVLSWMVVVWLEFVSLALWILPPLRRFRAATYHRQLQTCHIGRWLTSVKFWCKVFLFFFCVPQLYLWGSPLLGEIFAYVTVF